MEQKRILWLAVVAGAILLGFLGFFFRGRIFTPQKIFFSETKKLKIVTTFFPIYDFAREVGKDKIDLEILFSQTPEVVSFSPTEIQKIHKADIIIKNGAGLEPVLDELMAASDHPNIIKIDTSEGIVTFSPVEQIELTESGGKNKHGNIDPHIWLDPNNAVVQVENIRDAFALHDSANADFYRRNAEKYIRELRALDQEIQETLNKLHKKDFISFHSAFQYFAKRYGLNQAATIEEFPGKEPSPRYLSEVIKLIRKLEISSIFSEPQFSPKVVEVIAHDLNLKVYALDPIETGDPTKDSYISIQRKNLGILQEALQ